MRQLKDVTRPSSLYATGRERFRERDRRRKVTKPAVHSNNEIEKCADAVCREFNRLTKEINDAEREAVARTVIMSLGVFITCTDNNKSV